MRVDTNNIISVTEASKNVSHLISEAEDGRTYVVVRHNRPAAVIMGVQEVERLQALDDAAEDLRLLALSLVRTMTDDGHRHDLEDVIKDLGIDVDDEDDDEELED